MVDTLRKDPHHIDPLPQSLGQLLEEEPLGEASSAASSGKRQSEGPVTNVVTNPMGEMRGGSAKNWT